MMLTDLADACRSSGLEVIEEPGWRTRGHGEMTAVDTIACHHTATPLTVSGDYPSLGIVRDGRPGLDGPLAQLGLTRAGKVRVIAAGVCWHAGATWLTRQDNWHALGIEAEHDGLSPWPPELVAAYARLCRALADWYRVPDEHVQGHKEIAKPAGRKSDPNFDMDAFRDRVASLTNDQEEIDMTEDELKKIIRAELEPVVEAVKASHRAGNARANEDRARDLKAMLELKRQGRTDDEILIALKADA